MEAGRIENYGREDARDCDCGNVKIIRRILGGKTVEDEYERRNN